EVGQRYEYAMFLGDVAYQSLPPTDARRSRYAIVARPDAARRGRGADEDHARPIERRKRPCEAVPGVLADQYGRASPRRIECPNVVAALNESLLVEQPVRRQEVLAVHVQDRRFRAAQPNAHGAVVERVVPQFVEAEHDVQHAFRRHGGQIDPLQRRGERARRDGQFAHAAFQEVARERRFGEMQDIRARRYAIELREHGAEPVKIFGVLTLARRELQRGDLNEWWHAFKLAPPQRGSNGASRSSSSGRGMKWGGERRRNMNRGR